MEPRKNIADILIVGGSTVGSRVAGLVRDMLIYSLLGMSVYNSAFLFAFTLPNLFRRLLGEGALTSAFIPVLSSELENKGSSAFFSLINKVASRVLLVLVALTLAGCGVLLGMDALIELEARWHLAFKLGALLFPYAFLVCLSAVCGGALNNLGRFGTVAMTPIVLNICMITSLGIGGASVFGRKLAPLGYLHALDQLVHGEFLLFHSCTVVYKLLFVNCNSLIKSPRRYVFYYI